MAVKVTSLSDSNEMLPIDVGNELRKATAEAACTGSLLVEKS